ncbi:MAG TPA: YbbR-like domain-containing protein, partial [Myxococcota bacterium]|nr:YbbR-like domain-containing protein [Myxococcota bacterium]
MGPEDPSRTPPPPAPAPRPTRAAPRRGFLRRVFRENAGVKLISMVLAIALLVVVRQDTGKEVDIEVPVVLSDKADNDVFVGELPKTLRVRVRDRWSRLARALERKASPYLVDLRGFTNESIYVFDRERVQLLLGVTGLSIQSVYPSQFAVKTEPKVEVMVPVRPNLVGEVPEGYMVARDRARANPGEVRIWGARSSVQQVKELTTHPIDLAPLDKAARLEVLVQKPALPFVFLDQERVQVEVPVAEIEGRITLGQREAVVRNCPET